MPFEVRFAAGGLAAPGTPLPEGPCVGMLTCEMSCPWPGGAVSRGLALAAGDHAAQNATTTPITAARCTTLMPHPSPRRLTILDALRTPDSPCRRAGGRGRCLRLERDGCHRRSLPTSMGCGR